MTSLSLKRASASRPDGQWPDEDYDVIADGKVVGRIHLAHGGDVVSHVHKLKLGSEPLTIEMSAHLCWVGIWPPVTAANSLSASTRFSSLA